MSNEGSPPLWRYLALGDSYTIGEGVDASERWPAQLAQRLRQRDSIEVDLRVIAQTGWTVAELGAALDQAEARAELQPPYDLLSLLIGVNDQYRGHPPAQYRGEFCALLQRALGWVRERSALRVLSIPDWGVTPFAADDRRSATQIGDEIDAYNAMARAACDDAGVLVIDITDLTRQAAEDDSLLTGDGLHPSARDYARWVERVLASL